MSTKTETPVDYVRVDTREYTRAVERRFKLLTDKVDRSEKRQDVFLFLLGVIYGALTALIIVRAMEYLS